MTLGGLAGILSRFFLQWQVMYLLIDNYDSFTYNLWHYLGELGADVQVHRNDSFSVDEALRLKPMGIILSPGPCDPNKAGICLELVKAAAGNTPIFGVCLGHQAIGQALGGKIVRTTPMHGKVSPIQHFGHTMFDSIPSQFEATRYHSLKLQHSGLPECLEVTAETADGIIMGIAHREKPIYGVQFHPESVASTYGHTLLNNFLIATGHIAPSSKHKALK